MVARTVIDLHRRKSERSGVGVVLTACEIFSGDHQAFLASLGSSLHIGEGCPQDVISHVRRASAISRVAR
eukprot:878226-Prymnesium_polylepis.1